MSEREPITAELREWMRDCCYPHNTDEDGNTVAPTWEGVCDRCDAIDAVHAGLERENAELRERLAVLDESVDTMHEIGSATITITPTVDWTGAARELRAIADTLAGDTE